MTGEQRERGREAAGGGVGNGAVDLAHRQGRWIELAALDRRHYDPLWALVGSERVPWAWRGKPLGYESFLETLMSEALVQFPVIERSTGRCLGLIRADKANVYHQHAYVSLYMDPDFHKRGWPMEAMPLFVDYLFHKFNLHKVYGESSERSVDVGSLGGLATVEGVLKEHYFLNGEWVDMHIASVTREHWFAEVRPTLSRFLWRLEPLEAVAG